MLCAPSSAEVTSACVTRLPKPPELLGDPMYDCNGKTPLRTPENLVTDILGYVRHKNITWSLSNQKYLERSIWHTED